jgi:hypothetical protein
LAGFAVLKIGVFRRRNYLYYFISRNFFSIWLIAG